MPTVRINTYDQNTGVNGAALPQANIPGNFQIEANAARQFRMLGNALRGLAGVELRMRDAQRADQLNAARQNYMNDILREEERLGNEDTDYETQRERYVQFQKERRDFYGGHNHFADIALAADPVRFATTLRRDLHLASDTCRQDVLEPLG